MFKEKNIKSTEVFPADYPIFMEDEYVRIIYGAKSSYHQITNRQRILERRVTDESNWLLAAGGEKTAGDVSDWLEPETSGFKVLYVLAFGVFSDRNVKVKISSMGSGNYVFGTKSQGEAYVTPTLSPIDAPTTTIMALDTTFRPAFVLKNPSEYTLTSCVLGVTGFKYRFSDELAQVPKYFTTINMNNLLEA